eukprot:gb/GECG01008028.1/.p1 GENE.gb/GECG01008028.1/~~gb/GECG01008028.1/.p1  ORF type:complete len:179 (+),score=24.71 gb/GECG01008028.1/:1-537(+)
MATQLTWTIFPQDVLERLEKTVDEREIKETLVQTCEWPFEESAPLVEDQLYYALAFCRDNDFSLAETSVLLAIVFAILRADTERWEISMDESANHFSELLLGHSVERSPWSAQVLTPEHAEAAYDYILRSYYMHFRMYKYCLTSKPKLYFMQNFTSGLNTPERLLKYALNEAIELPAE